MYGIFILETLEFDIFHLKENGNDHFPKQLLSIDLFVCQIQ